MKKLTIALGLAVGLSLSAPQAHAVVIDFDALTAGTAPAVAMEDGFTLTLDDTLVAGPGFGGASTSTPDNEIERNVGSAGTLTIDLGGALFTFDSIDWEAELGTASVTVEGFLGAVSLGADTFTTSDMFYTTFAAVNLAGIAVDTLVIAPDRADGMLGALDTVVVTPVAEPATLAVFGLGLAGLGFRRRRAA